MAAMPVMLHLTVSNQIEELAAGIDAVEMLLDGWQVHAGDRTQVLVIMDEIASNIIKSAWPEGGQRSFAFDLRLEPSSPSMIELELLATDDGMPFDPTSAPPPDLDAPLEDREPGGLGLFLVRSLSASVEYRRIDGLNRLRVTKQLRRVGPPSPSIDGCHEGKMGEG